MEKVNLAGPIRALEGANRPRGAGTRREAKRGAKGETGRMS
jgi:hypothetical protein